MGMVRRRTRRRTMMVAGGTAYAAGRAGRGGGQADYGDEQEVPPAPPPPAPTAPTSGDPQADKIQHLSDLHDSGALTDEEFAAAKAKALGI